MASLSIRLLHHLLVYVSDLNRAVDFYTRLGMEPIPSLGPRIRWMQMGASELHLMRCDEPWQRFRDEPSPHFAIEASDIQQAEQLIPRIGGELLQETRARPHDGSLYFFALDPDGNRFEITQHAEDWHRRNALIEELKRNASLREPRVEGALRSVPRHLFLPDKTVAEAYLDQAIMTKDEGEARSSCSQPSIVAIMLEMLALRGGEKVLEVGAGTGWNAALMSVLAGSQGSVTTLDIDPDTVAFASANLERAQVENVRVVQADGGWGWAQGAPFDAIIAACGVSDIAPRWIEQLRHGGRLVAPMWFNTAQFCGVWEKSGEILVSSRLTWAGFMPLRGHFATARVVEHSRATFHADEMHGLDIPALRALLDTPAREVEVPELPPLHIAASPFVEYLALRGEPLLMVTPPSAPGALFALCTAPDSLLVLDARPRLHARLHGGEASLARLRELLGEWEASGKPGMAQAQVSVAPRGSLQAERGAFLVRKTWADYLVKFGQPAL